MHAVFVKKINAYVIKSLPNPYNYKRSSQTGISYSYTALSDFYKPKYFNAKNCTYLICQIVKKLLLKLVDVNGLEPLTLRTSSECSTN